MVFDLERKKCDCLRIVIPAQSSVSKVFSKCVKPSFWLTAALIPSLATHAANLLTNGDFSAQNTGFTTGYGYVASGTSTQVGSFGIRTSSVDFNSAYTPFGDHTTGTGYMMLLDGSTSPALGWSETVAVNPNQTYYFTGWLASSDASNPGSIRLSINNAQQGADIDLPATPGQWESFTIVWNSSTNTSAVLAISDDNLTSFGNDFALDDLSFSTGATAPVTASIYSAAEIDWPAQTNVNYQVQYSTALSSNNWLNLGGPVAGNGSTNMVFDSMRGQIKRFYRVLALP